MRYILCYDWTLATTFCLPPCHVSLSVFMICFVYMDWRWGPLPPWLLTTSCLVYMDWRCGLLPPCPLDCLPRPVHYTLYYHIHVSLSILVICLVYIDWRCSPLTPCVQPLVLSTTCWGGLGPTSLEAHGCSDTSQCSRRSRRVYKHLSVSSSSH